MGYETWGTIVRSQEKIIVCLCKKMNSYTTMENYQARKSRCLATPALEVFSLSRWAGRGGDERF